LGFLNAALKNEAEGRYEMAAQASYLDVKAVDWTGSLVLAPGGERKGSVNANLQSALHRPVSFSGNWLAADPSNLSVFAQASSDAFAARLESLATVDERGLKALMAVKYGMGQNALDKDLTARIGFKTTSNGALLRDSLHVHVYVRRASVRFTYSSIL